MSEKNVVPVSHQWIAVYHKAVAKAWSDDAFKTALLSDANAALKTVNFQVPANITVQFNEITGKDFKDNPTQDLTIFDTPQSSPVTFKVPLPPKAPEMASSLDHLASFNDDPTVGCCCICV